MIAKITLEVCQKGQKLPLSYQYEISALIYRLIDKSNAGFSTFLHQKGYGLAGKQFKMFTFSNLTIPPPYVVSGDRIELFSDQIQLTLSFLSSEVATHVVDGLCSYPRFYLGDALSGAELRVCGVSISEPNLSEDYAKLRTTSPVLASKPVLGVFKRTVYLSPSDEGFEDVFLGNLIDKYTKALECGWVAPCGTSPDFDLSFRLLSPNPKNKLITIKANTPQQTRLRGYLFDFELFAPKELIRVGMLAGFGSGNAIGFGATELLS